MSITIKFEADQVPEWTFTPRLPVEGLFTYRSGWTGRYDPNEGRYIGLDDIYLPAGFDPELGR